MELKQYQINVMRDLSRYLELLRETGSAAGAYRKLWEEKGVPVGGSVLPSYQDIIPGVPTFCFKVPTGGGKTFLACCAIRPIFEAMPPSKVKAVVWLVPSDAILAQTLKCLKSPEHPYRRQLARDFGSRLEVYSARGELSLEMLRNFNPCLVLDLTATPRKESNII